MLQESSAAVFVSSPGKFNSKNAAGEELPPDTKEDCDKNEISENDLPNELVGAEEITTAVEPKDNCGRRFQVGQRVSCRYFAEGEFNIWETGTVVQNESDYYAYIVKLDIGCDHVVDIDIMEFIVLESEQNEQYDEPAFVASDDENQNFIALEDLRFDPVPQLTEEEMQSQKPCGKLPQFCAQLDSNVCAVCGESYPKDTIMRFCTCECHGRHGVKVWCEKCYQRAIPWDLPSPRIYLPFITFITLTGFHFYWWVSYFRRNAGASVYDFHCTKISKLLIGYFTATTFCILFPAVDAMWPVSLCGNKSRTYLFTAAIILALCSLLVFIVWIIVDYFHLSESCVSDIQALGGQDYWHGIQTFVYINVITFAFVFGFGPYYVWRFCTSRKEIAKLAELAPNLKCKNDHRLRKYKSEKCISCVRCKEVKNNKATMYVCHQCAYAVCEACALPPPTNEEDLEMGGDNAKKRDPGCHEIANGRTGPQLSDQQKEFEHWKHQRNRQIRRMCKENVVQEKKSDSVWYTFSRITGFAICLTLLGFHLFWWVSFFLHNAAPNVMNSSSCNFFPELFITYFIITTLCCAIAGAIFKFDKGWATSSIYFISLGILLFGLFVVICIGVFHYFQMSDDCLDRSRDTGSDVFSFAMSSFAWIFIFPVAISITIATVFLFVACGCFVGYPSCVYWRDPPQEVKGNTREDGPYLVRLLASPTGPSGMTGFRAWHTSIEIQGKEYYFDGTGVETSTRRRSHNGDPYLDLEIGWTHRTAANLLHDLNHHFRKGYNLLGKNCNSFSDCALFYLFQIRLHPEFTILERKGLRCWAMKIFCWYMDCHSEVDFDVEEVIDRLAAILPAMDEAQPVSVQPSLVPEESGCLPNMVSIASNSSAFRSIPAILELGMCRQCSGFHSFCGTE